VTPDRHEPDVAELLERSIGQVVERSVVVIERGPATTFAEAIGDRNRLYRDPSLAAADGFDALPTPPTFPFVMEHWGRFPEHQPRWKRPDTLSLLLERLLSDGGSLLHAGQEFCYRRPVLVGDTLVGETTVADARRAKVMGRVLTKLGLETVWTDRADGTVVVMSRSTLVHVDQL